MLSVGLVGMDMNSLGLRSPAGPEQGRARSPNLNTPGIIQLPDGELFWRCLEPRRLHPASFPHSANGIADRCALIFEISPASATQVAGMGMRAKEVGIEVRVAAMRAHDMA